MREQISPVGRDDCRPEEAGFTLVELVCVIAILAVLAAIAVPAIPRSTSRAHLESYAVAVAALLKGDHAAAIRRQTQVASDVNTVSRFVRSGATGQIVQMPDDVTFDALLPAGCGHLSNGSTIRFLASGMSCGGVIALSHSGTVYEVRVNWLTGGVEIVPSHHS